MQAILISKDLAQTAADQTPYSGQIHSVFDHAVNCTFRENGWMTLLTEEAAVGPMGLVIRGQSFRGMPLVAGMRLELGRGRLSIPDAGIGLQLKGVSEWDPHFAEIKTPAHLPERRERLLRLESWLRSGGNLAGIANVLDSLELPGRSRKLRSDMELNAFGQFALERVQEFVRALETLDPELIRDKARGIIGFGPGLTPSGDDFLAGAGASLIALGPLLKLKKRVTADILAGIAEEAGGRTTRVSEEMLRHLAAGRLSRRMTAVQEALLSREGPDINQALVELGRMGETSGTDHGLGVLTAHRVLCSEETRRMQS